MYMHLFCVLISASIGNWSSSGLSEVVSSVCVPHHLDPFLSPTSAYLQTFTNTSNPSLQIKPLICLQLQKAQFLFTLMDGISLHKFLVTYPYQWLVL